MNVLEGNKLIAEFMGYEGQHEEWCGNNVLCYDELFLENTMRPYCPESKWDDLMPVVEKISKECGKDEKLHYWWNTASVSDIRIFRETKEDTWSAVVEFIKFYNINISVLSTTL